MGMGSSSQQPQLPQEFPGIEAKTNGFLAQTLRDAFENVFSATTNTFPHVHFAQGLRSTSPQATAQDIKCDNVLCQTFEI